MALTGTETLLVTGVDGKSRSSGESFTTTTQNIAQVGGTSPLSGLETLQVRGVRNGKPSGQTFRTTTGYISALATGGTTNLTGSEVLQVTGKTSAGGPSGEKFTTTTQAIANLRVAPDFKVNLNYVGLAFGNVFPGTPGTDYFVPVASDFVYYATKNIRKFRLSVRWERCQLSLNGALYDPYFVYIDNAISYAVANGQTIIIAMFDECVYNGQVIGGGTVTTANFADLWGRIAARYAGNAGVSGYDLMNEPVNMPVPGVTWPAAAQAAITAIRAFDTTTAIYVDGEDYSNAYFWQTVNPNLHTLVDPNHNLIFSAHFYCDADSSGTGYDWLAQVALGDELDPGSPLTTNIGVKRMTPFAQWLQTHGFKGNIGECGVGTQTNNIAWLQCLDKAMTYARAQNISFSYFSGALFTDTYPYYAGPSTVNPAIDLTQMAILTKYSGATQPSTYFLSIAGSNYTPPSTPSNPISVYYRGILSADTIVTPSDGGAGGTFTPSTITFLAGAFNPSGSFTYTPSGASVTTISLTNNKSLTNPANFTIRSSGYNYASIPGIIALWDSNDPTKFSTGTSAVWTDSINGYQALATSGLPTYGVDSSGGYVGFNGTQGFSSINLVTSVAAGPFTVYTVLDNHDESATQNILMAYNGASQSWGMDIGDFGGKYIRGFSTSNAVNHNASATPDVPVIRVIRRNGTLIEALAADGTTASDNSASDATINNGFTMGMYLGGTPGYFANGKFRKIIVTTTALSDAVLNAISAGVIAEIPATQPWTNR